MGRLWAVLAPVCSADAGGRLQAQASAKLCKRRPDRRLRLALGAALKGCHLGLPQCRLGLSGAI